MILYDKNNNPKLITDFNYLTEGTSARIYVKDDVVLKEYKCNKRFIITKEVFETLKNSKIENIVELYDYYYVCCSKLKNLYSIDYHTMKYIKDNKVSLLYADIKYLEEVAKKLEITLRQLCENRIIINDTHEGNIIFSENGVTIIDPDLFLINKKMSDRQLYLYNKSGMIKYINSTVNDELFYLINRNFTFITSFEDDRTFYDEVMCNIKEDNIYNTLKLRRKYVK